MASTTFIDEVEEVVDEVAHWGADIVQSIIDAIAPDGRPFGTTKKTPEEQLDEYRLIRNDVNAWMLWLSNKQQAIITQLMSVGIEPEHIAAINPLQIATSFMLDYSIRMERMLNERMV